MEHSNPLSEIQNKLYDYAGIPDTILRILGDLEKEKRPFLWTLQRNVDKAMSFTLNFPPTPRTPKAKPGNRRPPPPTRKQEILRKPTSTVTCEETPSHPVKKKSPSCTRRDMKRHQRWIRKFHHADTRRRSCDKGHPPQHVNTNQKVPDSLPSVVLHDSDIISQKSPDSGCLPDSAVSNPTVKDNLCRDGEDIGTTNEPAQPSTASSDTLQDMDSTPLDSSKERDTPQEFDIEAELLIQRTFCVECNKPGASCPSGLKACMQCKVCHYCSKQCQLKHWKSGHRDDCAEIARLGALRPRSQS